MYKKTSPIACFVTPHGYGHASRAAAVLEGLHDRLPDLEVHLFTLVPEWFFTASFSGKLHYHSLLTDIGLVQKSPFDEDLPETLAKLDRYIPFSVESVNQLAGQIQKAGCKFVICDISTLGLAVAQKAGIPGILIENFTWDWIYRAYSKDHPAIQRFIDLYEEMNARADVHIQTEPICNPVACDLSVPPISRSQRRPKNEVRRDLGIPENARCVLVTMGGVPDDPRQLEPLLACKDTWFILPGTSQVETTRQNLVQIPARSRFFHPDLVHASDAVIGKAGYSTIAEVNSANIPFGYILRDRFPESQPLDRFIRQKMRGHEIPYPSYADGTWIDYLPSLFEIPGKPERSPNGLEPVVDYLLRFM